MGARDEENGEKVERGVTRMLQVVRVPDEGLVGSVDVGLGCVLHDGEGEEIGEATDEEDPDTGQEKPDFVAGGHLSQTKGGSFGPGLGHV